MAALVPDLVVIPVLEDLTGPLFLEPLLKRRTVVHLGVTEGLSVGHGGTPELRAGD
jgi:hypothetical protein